MPLETITTATVADAGSASTDDRLKALMADEQRINDVFGRLVTSNVELCGDQFVPSFGFKLWSIEDFQPQAQEAAAAAFGLDSRLAVYAVAADQPAAKAGVKPGDILVSIEGRKLEPGAAGRRQFSEGISEGLLKRGAVKFGFERAKKKYRVTLNALKSCPISVALTIGDEPNAATDGEQVFITTGMLKFAAEDRDLATVLGHEMAHAIARHPQRLRGETAKRGQSGLVDSVVNTATELGEAAYTVVRGLAGARRNSIAFEIEADYVGLYLAARAGYDVSNAASIWRRLEQLYPESSDGGWTHPSSEERFGIMSATALEIARKREEGLPLFPNTPGS